MMQRFYDAWRSLTGQGRQQAEATVPTSTENQTADAAVLGQSPGVAAHESRAHTISSAAGEYDAYGHDSQTSAEPIAVPLPQRELLIRQHAAENNPSAAIYHVPHTMPMADLYNPDMVKITVYQGEGYAQTFTVPRGLISNKSEYFKRAFSSGFKETEKGEIELKDLEPWVFEVFIGWLYTGRVFLDATESGEKASMSDASRRQKRKFSDLDHVDDEEEEKRAAPSLRTQPQTAAWGHQLRGSAQSPVDSPPSPLNTSSRYGAEPEGGDEGWKNRTERTAEQEDQAIAYANPINWPWAWLFSIFIFADRCDTRELRMLVLDLVELKLYCQRPHSYLRPSNDDIWVLYDNLPASSGLRRMIVHCFAKDTLLSADGDDKEEQANTYEGLPHAFLLETLLAAKAHIYATRCGDGECRCEGGPDHETWEGAIVSPTCTFHEHGDNQEEADMCYEKWEALWAAYCG